MGDGTIAAEPTIRSRWEWLYPCLLVVLWGLHVRFLLDPSLHVGDSDAFHIEIPNRLHAARIIRDGEFPFWTFAALNGWPIFSECVTGVLYPFFATYCFLPNLRGHDLFFAGHVLLGTLLAFCYLRTFVRDPLAAFAASCGWFLFLEFVGMILPAMQATFAWFPLCLWLLDRVIAGSRAAAWQLCLVNALAFLAGEAQESLLSWLSQALYLVAQMPLSQWLRTLRVGLIAYVLPVACVAVQIVPLYRYMQQSHRAEGVSLETRLSDTLPSEAAEIAAIAIVVLAILASVNPTRRRKTIALFLVASVNLMLASDTALHRVAYHLGIVAWFRQPQLHFTITAQMILVLLAGALDTILAGLRRVSGWIGLPLWSGTAVAGLALAAALMAQIPGPTAIAQRNVYVAPEFLNTVPEFANQLAQASGANATVAQAPAHLRMRSYTVPRLDAAYPGTAAQQTARAKMPRYLMALPPNIHFLFNLNAAGIFMEFQSLTPRDILEFDQLASRLDRTNLLVAEGVTHLVGLEPLEPRGVAERKWEVVHREDPWVYRLPGPRRRAWMVYETVKIPERAERLKFLERSDFDALRLAIVEEPLGPYRRPPNEPTVLARQVRHDTVELEIYTEEAGLCVLTERRDPDLVARLDGVEVPLLRVNHAFCGIGVPMGDHRIEVFYRPWRFGWLVTVSALATGFATIQWFRTRRI